MQEANTWSPDFWGLSNDDWVELVGCVRSLNLLGRRKLGHLVELPYLLSRLAEPGVKAQVDALWAARPAHEHHRVTRSFMQRFADDVANIGPDGTPITARLATELAAMNGTPMDDSVAEGPHARLKTVSNHSRASGFAWVAATTRLSQTLQDLKTLPSSVGVSLESCWVRPKSILQPEHSRRRQKNVKMTDRIFHKRVYEMDFLNMPVDGMQHLAADGGGENGDDANDDDSAGSSNDSSTSSSDSSSASSSSSSDSSDDDNDGDNNDGDGGSGSGSSAPGPPRTETWAREDPNVQLMRQWLASTLATHDYFTVDLSHAGDKTQLEVFQLLSFEKKLILVGTHGGQRETDALFEVSVQPLETWSNDLLRNESSSSELHVFPLKDPCVVDILSLAGDFLLDRSRWQRWTASPGEVDCCIRLASPAQLAWSKQLLDANVPILALMDALDEAGFEAVKHKVQHTTDVFQYNCSFPMRSRAYYQCVLSMAALAACGVGEFSSGLPQAFYQLLLKKESMGGSHVESQRVPSSARFPVWRRGAARQNYWIARPAFQAGSHCGYDDGTLPHEIKINGNYDNNFYQPASVPPRPFCMRAVQLV